MSKNSASLERKEGKDHKNTTDTIQKGPNGQRGSALNSYKRGIKMIRSMTAFAKGDATIDDVQVSLEMRTFNNRYLDVTVRLPQACQPLEVDVKTAIGKAISRGRVEMRLQLNGNQKGSTQFRVDQDLAQGYLLAAKTLQETFDLKGKVNVTDLLQVHGMILPEDKEVDLEPIKKVIDKILSDCLGKLIAMRETEGRALAADMADRIKAIRDLLDQIEAGAKTLPQIYKERLQKRIAQLLDGEMTPDPDRLAQEVAHLADRSDISEEVVRARSHLDQFDHLMEEDASGRKLNFLLQELHREFNTMGSKVGHADLAHLIVAVKAELEKIREQVQNVE